MADNNDSLQESPSQILCAKGCGFFGSASTMSMCSKCFREHQKSTGDVPQPSPTGAPASAATAPGSAAAAAAAAASAATLVAVSTGAPAFPSPLSSGAGALPAMDQSPGDDANAAAPAAAAPQPRSGSPPAALPGPLEKTPSAVDLYEDDEAGQPARKIQKNRGRCFSCKKKVGLTGFDCKCGYTFCSSHRHSDQHDCDYDYKTEALDKLARDNPVVVAPKIDKI